MMDQDNLASSLYVDQVDPEELAQVVLETLGGAKYESVDEVIYYRPGHPPALYFVFKGNELRTVKAGPGLSADDIASIQTKIRTDLLDLGRKIVGRMIIFSAYPVTGHLRIGDFLQICPVPSHAPRPKDSGEGDHPFLIEFEVYDSPNLSIRIDRIYSQAQKLSLFLSAIAEGKVTFPSTSSHFSWVIRNDPKPQYEHMLEGYGYAEFQRHQKFFTECDAMPSIERVDDRKYFGQTSYEPGRPLQLPNSFDQLFNIFLQLRTPLQDKFSRAAYWYSLAQSQESSSASFLHLIQSIETLVPPAEVRQECTACKKELEGPTQRFKDFIDELVPAHSELNRARSQLYKLRSDLSHGRDICGRDLGRNNVPRSAEQMKQVFEAYQLARLALVNWLITQGARTNGSVQPSTIIPLA